MKKTYTSKLVAAMMLAMPCAAMAQDGESAYGSYDFVAGGIYYDILSQDGDRPTCAVSDADQYSYYKGDVTIPEQVEHDGKTYTVTAIGTGAFDNCTELISVSVPNTVTKIFDNAFSTTGITEIELPSSLETIGVNAFYGSHLTSITIPNSVTSVGTGVLSGCGNLKTVVIGNSLKTISQSAFLGCVELEDVTIGSSVETIEGGVFMTCSNLKTVTVLNPVPPTVADYAFYSVPTGNATLRVPEGSAQAYRSAPTWGDFGQIVEFEPTGITNVEAGAAPAVAVTDGCITVSNAEGEVSVYSLSGAKVGAATAGGSVTIPVAAHGVYIVKVGGTAVKVAM